jgi:hypothetical protein
MLLLRVDPAWYDHYWYSRQSEKHSSVLQRFRAWYSAVLTWSPREGVAPATDREPVHIAGPRAAPVLAAGSAFCTQRRWTSYPI